MPSCSVLRSRSVPNRALAAVVITTASLLAAWPPLEPHAAGNTGLYDAIIDRVARPKPTTPAPPAAGDGFVDTVFGSRLLRVTDANTRPGAAAVSYRSPSGSHQNAW